MKQKNLDLSELTTEGKLAAVKKLRAEVSSVSPSWSKSRNCGLRLVIWRTLELPY